MYQYSYDAMNEKNEVFSGTYEAECERDVVCFLKRHSYFVLEIRNLGDVNKSNMNILWEYRGRIGARELAILSRQLAISLKVGIPLLNAIDHISGKLTNQKLKIALMHISENIQKGDTLNEAFKDSKVLFPTLFIHMLEAGEESGNLDITFERLAIYYEREKRITNKIKNALSYPILLMLVCMVVVVYMITNVLPVFTNMLFRMDQQIPPITKGLMNLSDSISHYWYIYIVTIILVVLILYKFLKTANGKSFLHQLRLQIPIIKNIEKKIIMASFARTLSMLLSSGVPLLRSIDIVEKVIPSTVAKKSMKNLKTKLAKGCSITEVLKNEKIFDPVLLSMIHTGENTGNLDEMLSYAANLVDEELEESIQKVVSLVEPMMLLIMAMIIGTLVIAMILPMFEIIEAV